MSRGTRLYKIEGVILRRKDLGEADRILTIFSRTRGKIRVVAKGVKKPTSRKAGFVELLTHISAVISKGSSLDILSQVDVIESFPAIREDLTKTSYGAHFCELVDSFTEDEDANESLFQLLASALGWLTTSVNIQLAARYFEIHLLKYEGFQPEVFNCVHCGKELSAENQFFSIRTGGVICSSCGVDMQGTRPISLNTLKVLRFFIRHSFDEVASLSISEPVLDELEYILQGMIVFNLEKKIKTAPFIRRLRRENFHTE